MDRNEYYGDEEAALTLQELDQWVQQVNDASRLGSSSFSKAHILQPNTRKPEELSFSRAYSLSLSPLIIYCSSPILPLLVSSQVYRQVEFLAVGSWWILDESGTKDASPSSSSDGCSLSKIPSGREDVFSDDTVSLKHKRALMKFLKFIQSYEAQRSLWKAYDTRPLPEFLSSEYFELPDSLQKQLFATSLSALPMQETETGWAIEMIARHLRSIGIFSAGIGSVVPKWGGMGEICQVACRACAVGGGTYVLKKGISDVEVANDSEHMGYKKLNVRLDGGETVETQYLSRSNKIKGGGNYMEAHHSISIINSSLHHLFPSFGEDEPTPAVAMVVIPTGLGGGAEHHPPVYIQVHSSETGECPQGQCRSIQSFS